MLRHLLTFVWLLSFVSTWATTKHVDAADVKRFVTTHCADCHAGETAESDLDLSALTLPEDGGDRAAWERVVRKLTARQMPPSTAKRPTEDDYDTAIASLERQLDELASAHPRPGRTETLRRLTRTEYQNAIRDLLAVEIDASKLLPPDESSHGFDNITVGDLSPTLLNRYISAAQRISRLAVGGASRVPAGETFRIPADITQEEHVPGLPIGTRGGTLIPFTFPQDGDYDVRVRLARDRNEMVEGLRRSHELEILVDRRRVAAFTVRPPKDKNHSVVDAHLKKRVSVKAGLRQLGITFVKQPSSLVETKRQPYEARFNMHRHARTSPAVYQVTITGPHSTDGPGTTRSRELLFSTMPKNVDDERSCAKTILKHVMRRAYRREVRDDDTTKPLQFYDETRELGGDFDAGIEVALSSILVNPNFLFRIERDPQDVEPGTAYKVNDYELASRLSFFLWSSIPDDELLDAAKRGELSDDDVLVKQVQRMLHDDRSQSLVTNFASQWLYLRNLDSITPNARLFPDFDDNLRQAFRQETELFFASVMRENRSVLDLLKADYTFVNERLAKHYGLPHIYGSRFRRVSLTPETNRGGLLRHGSILTVTSYATRTSPVIRGHWILKNLVGSPPPPPPADVPALKDNTVSANLSVRARLAEHRANVACASCHNIMDPVGFTLENYDAVGRWRELEEGEPVDASGGLPDGSEFTGVSGLEEALLRRPEWFVRTLTGKLLTFGLGRGINSYDAPAIRKIVRDAKADDYKFSALIHGVVRSVPFQMRAAVSSDDQRLGTSE